MVAELLQRDPGQILTTDPAASQRADVRFELQSAVQDAVGRETEARTHRNRDVVPLIQPPCQRFGGETASIQLDRGEIPAAAKRIRIVGTFEQHLAGTPDHGHTDTHRDRFLARRGRR